MLRTLRVKDFVLVADAELDVAAGLCALTGETGTGKSILLAALGLLLGRRGSATWVRQGADALRVEGVFDADRRVRAALRSLGLPHESPELVVCREVDRHGRSRCAVNARRVLVSVLRRLGTLLVEIHGQREEERFRLSEVQRELLDLHGGHQALRRAVRDAHRADAQARAALVEQRARLARLAAEEDWLRYQVEEIAQIDPQPDEIEALRARLGEVRRGAELARLAELAEQILNGRPGAVLESLEELDHELTRAAPEGEAWDALRAEIAALLGQARETHRKLRRLGRDGSDEAAEVAQCEARLASLEQLERKHRRPLPEILSRAQEMREALAELADGQRLEGELSAGVDGAAEALGAAAARLSAARAESAPRLARALEEELQTLGMAGSRVRVALEPLRAPVAGAQERDAADAGALSGADGAERVVFEIETNPGEGFRPWGEIASGGEMSRLALAVRVVLGGAGRGRLLVFDEIDAGLGGAAARAVAARLARVGRHHQVLLVTHLPVIAAAADQQFRVWKEKSGRRNVARVAPVTAEAREAEIARMLSGAEDDARARAHARALLREAC